MSVLSDDLKQQEMNRTRHQELIRKMMLHEASRIRVSWFKSSFWRGFFYGWVGVTVYHLMTTCAG
jgi:hypothetical protein